MLQIIIPVSASLDDTLIQNGVIYSIDWLQFGLSVVSGINESAMIFRNISIPKESIISNAYIIFNPYQTDEGTVCNLKFVAEASSNPDPFSTYEDYIGRSLGSTEVDWNNVPSFITSVPVNSINISTIIQEVINRSDWNNGGGINIFLKNNNSDSGAKRLGLSYDNSPANCPKLVITYLTKKKLGNYGLKISKKDKSVIDAKGNSLDLVYNSEKKYLFIAKEGMDRYTYPDTVHGLDYFPAHMTWGEDSSGNFYRAVEWSLGGGLNVDGQCDNYRLHKLYSAGGDEFYYMIFNNP